jgi:valyl-tRNA synthetase
MEKTYNPHSIEQKWYKVWEENKYFKPGGSGEPYSIVIPPPNVTGSLHMGHGFQLSLMDALIRYHRMQGYNTLWQVGTDHAGIATQILVEQQLLAKGITRQTLGREKFVAKIWEWKEYSGNTIAQQQRRLGISADWDRERFTLDEGLSEAVLQVFIKLYEEKIIYRGKRLINWDPILQTAVSDLEVINEEQEGKLWFLRYQIIDTENIENAINNETTRCIEKYEGKYYLLVATTRPETIFGDVAIAVPTQTEYKNLIGKKVCIPLADKTISIIADEYVDKDFGTGCVKITPAHDFNDYAVGKRHNLPFVNIFTKNAHLNENVPKKYQGMELFAAREIIIKDLIKKSLLQSEINHKHIIPKGERTGSIIEPYLTDQWFVDAKKLAVAAIDVVKKGDIKFVPENWAKTYFQWLENIEDWCISRQLWWGHRIPAWYDDKNNIYVGHDLNEVIEKYQLAKDCKLTQDEDVLDTWFSSALWPFSTFGWPEQTDDLKTFYPTNVLVTGFDIIFFWVARMVMMGMKFTGQVPFHEVYITGLIRDSKGQKMSKSKGNVIDPIDLIDGISLSDLLAKRTSNLLHPGLVHKIEKATKAEFPHGIQAFGTDALRFTFCALASTGRDINFDVGRLEGYRNFCNKIWNASRYVFMQIENFDYTVSDVQSNLADNWIKSKLRNAIIEIEGHFKDYRFDLIAQTLYDFIWREYCDWYLELCKPILASTKYKTTDAQKNSARKTLIEVLEAILRLAHPLMPFITEEIWQQLAPIMKIANAKTIMLQKYPSADDFVLDENALTQIEWLKSIVNIVRTIRGENNIDPGTFLPKIWFKKGNETEIDLVQKIDVALLLTLTKIENFDGWVEDTLAMPTSFTDIVGTLEIHVQMSVKDKDAEIARLNKEIEKLVKEIEILNKKLSNEDFVKKAPKDIVVKETQRLDQSQNTLNKLQTNLQNLQKQEE